jgi:hypothetical protein
MGKSTVMDAPSSPAEAREFEAFDTENRIAEEEFEQEIAAAKGERTLSEIDRLDGCDPRNQRVEDSERDARLRHKDYDRMIDRYIIPAIHKKPELFTVLRDSVDAGEAAYTLAQLLENPRLAEQRGYQDFQSYLQDVSERRTGKFENLSLEAFEKVLDAYKEHADNDESIEDFFSK